MLAVKNKLEPFLESHCMHEIVGGLIALNAIILGLLTSESIRASIGPQLAFLDHLLIYIFLGELILRLIASGTRFFKSGWNWFDAFTVLIALIPAGEVFSALRVLRIFRVMRLVSFVPNMNTIVTAVVNAVPGIINVAGILLLMFYMSSLIAYNLFAQYSDVFFGTLSRTMYTLFQLMLADDWGNVTRPILEKSPYAYLFFIPFMVGMTFTILNLFFGLVVNAMQGAAEAENDSVEETTVPEKTDKNTMELDSIKNDLKEIKLTLNNLINK